MKQFIWISLLLSSMISACSGQPQIIGTPEDISGGNVTIEVGEAADSRQVYSAEQRSAYQKGVQQQIAMMDNRIEDLRHQAQQASPNMQAKLNRRVENLQQKQMIAAEKITDLMASRGEDWAERKVMMDAAMKDMQQAYEDAIEEFN